jgi:predicted permease
VGSAVASTLAGWLAVVMACASVLLLGISFYSVYVKGRKSPTALVIVWGSLLFVVVVWTWHAARKGYLAFLFPG